MAIKYKLIKTSYRLFNILKLILILYFWLDIYCIITKYCNIGYIYYINLKNQKQLLNTINQLTKTILINFWLFWAVHNQLLYPLYIN